MGLKITNNAFATLAASISDSVTSITVASGQGSRFPTLGGTDYFYATLVDISNNVEIVKCTARIGDVLTVVRAQDGTTAKAYVVGDRLEIRPIAALFDEKADVTYVDSEISTLDAAKMDYVVPGAAGNVLKSDGTNWISDTIVTTSSPIAYGYTSPGTWTKPSNIVGIYVRVQGGGGTGGNGASGGGLPPVPRLGGAGGGGGFAEKWMPAPSVPGPQAITAGPGTNSFGAICSATGGGNGANASPTTSGASGAGGTGVGGTLNLVGRSGVTVAGGGGLGLIGGGGAGPGNSPPNMPGHVIVEEFY